MNSPETPPKPAPVYLGLVLPESLNAKLEQRASDELTSKSAIVRRALLNYFQNANHGNSEVN